MVNADINSVADLTAILMTKNEEANIERCISSIKNLASRIIVVDSYSDDRTVEIAKSLGAEVYQHPWKHYADQFNWALDNIKIDSKWIMRIDADEQITPKLSNEIKEQIQIHDKDDVNGFIMKFKVYFLGRFMMHGGNYPFYNLTIFRNGYGKYEDRAMGEHIVLSEGRAVNLHEDCIHYDFKSLTSWIDKHNKYATREVIDRMEILQGKFDLAKLDAPAERSKRLRDKLYYRLPPFFRAKLFYIYRYYFKMGFLDGRPGKIWAFMQAYWYRYLIDAKLYEQEINMRK